jgi:hypothetical protein
MKPSRIFGTLLLPPSEASHDPRDAQEEKMSEQRTHVVIRTNPKGQPLVGRCALCGKEGLSSSDALKPCPNPRGVSSDDALLSAITGDVE